MNIESVTASLPQFAAETATRNVQNNPQDTLAFSELLSKLVATPQAEQEQADSALASMMTGEADIHQVMLACAKADLSFKMLLEVRNKLLDAYQEISRMQV